MTNLLEGSIPKSILKFTLPLFLSNLFQLMYSTADAFIVGNWVGSSGLAAVGSSDSLIFLMISFFVGLSMGSGVVCARYFGQNDMENLRKAIGTTLAVAFLTGIIHTFVGVIFAPEILRLMDTPSNVLPESIAYFRALFSGGLAMVMFNMTSGILQSLGDSKTPMKFLLLSSVLNIILDCIFIIGLGYGVRAAGYATVISQGVSALLSLRVIFKSKESWRPSASDLMLDRQMAAKILKQGIPSGVQMSVISLANVFVQASINGFGASAMAGCGANYKIQGFAFLPINCFTMTISTFVSQNLGAGRKDRVKKGTAFSLAVSISLAEIMGIIIYVFAGDMVSLFSQDARVIEYGVEYIKITSLFYCLMAYSHCCASILRGYGRPMIPMAIMLVVWCLIRVSFIVVMLKFLFDIRVVFWAYPLTWAISSALFTFFVLSTTRSGREYSI